MALLGKVTGSVWKGHKVYVMLLKYSLVPSPTPSFPSLLSTVKRGGPGTFPHVSDVKGRKG